MSFNKYIEVLLLERRESNRQGFPGGVLRELFLLREYYAMLHPETHCTGPATIAEESE